MPQTRRHLGIGCESPVMLRRPRCGATVPAAMTRIPRAMTAPGPATSGIADLDRTLGGLFWGDNVVWEVRRHASVEPFVRALVSAGGQAEAFAHVALERRGGAAPDGGSTSSTPRRTARARGPGELLVGRARLRAARRAHDPRLRPARRHGRALGRRDRPPLLRALLPDAARDRRHRVLVDRGLRRARGAAARGRGDHAVRARGRRPPRAHRQGRRAPAGRRGQRADRSASATTARCA